MKHMGYGKRIDLRLLCALTLLAIALFCFAACTDGSQGEETTVGETVPDVTEPNETVEDATNQGEDSETVPEETTEEVTTLRELVMETYDPALDNSTVDTGEAHVVDQSQWIVTDGLDRVMSTNTQTGDIREDKIVAIFYWTWHGNFGDSQTAYNNQQNINKLLAMGKTERDYMTLSMAELKALGV